MKTNSEHSCVSEFCDKCKQYHCKCSPCPPPVPATCRDQLNHPSIDQPERLRSDIKESWILKRFDGWYCYRCKLYYKDPAIHECPNCLSSGFMTRKTWYKRIMLENIAAVVIWGIATGGIAWAILLAAKIFFNIHLGIWTNIYDTTDPKEEPIPATIFSKEIFLSRFLGLPILLILIILVVAAIFFFGILFMGVLNNAFR